MKRLYIISILFCLVGFVYGQNQQVLDLSNGGVSIKGVKVVKNESNNFIVLCNTNIEFTQIILNAGIKDNVVVKDLSMSDASLFTESTKNKTDIKQHGDKVKTIFSFENGHDYQILHNKKTWNLKVRQKGYSAIDLYPKGKNLYIGDSCVQLKDTMHITLSDSMILGKWDAGITLIKNGKLLADSLLINVNDSCCYFIKINMDPDSVLHANDTLCINLNKKKYILVCDDTLSINSNYWVYLMVVVPILLLFIIGIMFRQRIILAFKTENKEKALDSTIPTQGIDNCIQDKKTELFNQLEGLIDNLLKLLPKKVNELNKKKLFEDRRSINGILSSLEIIEAINKKSWIEKCKKIREFIEENEAILKADSSVQPSNEDILMSSESKVPSEKDIICDTEWYMQPLSIIEPLEIKEENKEGNKEGITKETINKVRDCLATIGDLIDEKIRTAKDQGQTLANQTWQTKFEELSSNYTELQNSYNEDLVEAKEQAKNEVTEEFKTYIADIEKKVEEAETKAKEAEKTKEDAVNEAIRKEKDAHKAETLRLQKEKEDAEEKAEKAVTTKKQAVVDAVRKEKASHEKTEKELKEAKEKAEKKLKEKKLSYEKSQKELLETKIDRDKRVNEVKQLKIAQEEYTNSLERVPFAEQYSKQIRKIMELGGKIQTSAYSLLDTNVDDPYFIMKALSKYGKMIDGINMENFYTDVNLASKAKFILKDSFLAKFKEDNKDIDSIMRSYFFNQYLEKYINSIMVLNESMCGLKLLLPELQTKVGCFEQYRDELLDLAKKLKINVLYVKVGDMAGINIDLKPTAVGVEIGKPGQILEIQNCIVYQSDKSKPQTRINVIIKK